MSLDLIQRCSCDEACGRRGASSGPRMRAGSYEENRGDSIIRDTSAPDFPPRNHELGSRVAESFDRVSALGRDTRPIDWLAARIRTLPLRPFQAAKSRRQNAIAGVPFACYPRRELCSGCSSVGIVVELGAWSRERPLTALSGTTRFAGGLPLSARERSLALRQSDGKVCPLPAIGDCSHNT
jgi:hypothetical protein